MKCLYTMAALTKTHPLTQLGPLFFHMPATWWWRPINNEKTRPISEHYKPGCNGPKKLSSIQFKSLPNGLKGRSTSMPQNYPMTSWPLRAIRKERCLSIIQQQFHIIKKPVVSVSLSIQVTSSNMQLQTRRHLQWYDFFHADVGRSRKAHSAKNNCVNCPIWRCEVLN